MNQRVPVARNLGRGQRFLIYMRNHWQLYLLLMVPVAFVIVFKYAAYPGLQIAFMNFKPAKGFAGSAWVGWENFEKIFPGQGLPPCAAKLLGL